MIATDELASPRWSLASTDLGTGTPVVLLHAFPVDRRLYSRLADRMAVRLIAPDLPGFGDTPLGSPAPAVLSVELLAHVVQGWLERECLDRVVLGGTAIGGYVALEIAARAPHLVDGLVLMGCKAAPDAPARAADREGVARLALEAGSVELADVLTDAPLGPDANARTRRIVHCMIERADPRGVAALVRGIAIRPDPTPLLRRLTLPTLVIAGEDDPFCSVAEARSVAELAPRASFVAVPGAGHFAAFERPLVVAAAIERFVRMIELRGRYPRDPSGAGSH